MSVCPPKKHPKWIELVAKLGENRAWTEWLKNGKELPNPDEYTSYYDESKKNKKGRFDSVGSSLPQKSASFTRDSINGIHSMFMNAIFASGLTPDILFKNKGAVRDAYLIVNDTLQDLLVEAEDQGNEELANDYYYLLDNWATRNGVVAKHQEFMKTFGVSFVKGKEDKTGKVAPMADNIEDPSLAEQSSVDVQETKTTEQGAKDTAFLPANSISTKDLLYKQTKLLLSSLTKQVVDEFGKIKTVKNAMGLPDPVDVGATYNYLLLNLAGEMDLESMIQKLHTLSSTRPELNDLIKRLGCEFDEGTRKWFIPKALTNEQVDLQNQFRQDFDKNQATGYKTLLRADGVIYLIDATRENTGGRVKEQWRNKLPSLFPFDNNGRIVAPAGHLKMTDSRREYLEKIGITFSKETMPALQGNVEFSKAVSGIMQYIEDKKGDLTDLYGEKSTVKGNLAVLYDLEAKFTPDVTELSYISTEGKTIYSISLNNAMSIMKNLINKAPSKTALFATLPHLNTVGNKNAIWINEMFDSAGNRKPGIVLNFDLLDGMSTQSTESIKVKKDQSQTSGLSKGDKMVMDLNTLLLEGKTAVIRTGDKASEFAASISGYKGKQKLPVSFDELAKDTNSTRLKEIFRGYFKDEFNTIAESALFDLGKGFDQYRNITNWDNGKLSVKWRIFDDFPESSAWKERIKEGLTTIKNEDKPEIEKRKDIDKLFEEVSLAVDASTVEFFRKYTNELTDAFERVGVNTITKKGISKELLYNSKFVTKVDKDGVENTEEVLTERYSFEQVMRATAVNDFINSVEQTKVFFGDMAFYKDFIKRTQSMVGTKKTVRTDKAWHNWLNTNYKRFDGKKANGKINVWVFEDSVQKSKYLDDYVNALMESGMGETKAREILDAYAKMEEGDAQGHITLDEYREFFKGVGDWLPEHQAQYEYEMAVHKQSLGQEFDAEAIEKGNPEFYFMPIKAQYAGPQVAEGLHAPAYHKYSLVPLQYSMVKGRNLEVLLNDMNANQIGYTVFKSGSKVGTPVDANGLANKFYQEDGTINNKKVPGTHGNVNTANRNTQVIDYRFLGIQLDIAPKIKKEVVFGTQFRKLLFSNIFEDGKEKMKGGKKLFEDYSAIFDRIIQVEKAKLIKELGINERSYKAEDVKKLVQMLRKASEDRGLSDNIIDAIQEEEIDGKFYLKYKLDHGPNKDKVSSMIMGVINARLVKQMMNGDAMVQVASTGFEKIGKRVEGSNELKFYRQGKKIVDGKEVNVTLPMEIKVPLTGEYLELCNEKYEGSIDKLNAAIKAGEVESQILEWVGYRIPTQGMNSIEYMTIQEFLPTSSGIAIVLPTEIVAKSGGDFDIDKLNIFRPWLNPKTQYELDQNDIIRIAKEILTHDHNFGALITPNSTKIIVDIVDEVRYVDYVNKKTAKNERLKADGKPQEGIQSFKDYTAGKSDRLKQVNYTSQLKLTFKVEQFEKLLGGKSGVGIGAIQNTHHIVSQIANLKINTFYKDSAGKKKAIKIKFPHNSINKTLEDGRVISEGIHMSKLKDRSGLHDISEVVSQVINASVDIARDPFMFDINMNEETLNTYLYLIRTGVDFEQVAYFMRQPIISEYLTEIRANDSVFLKAAGIAKKKSKVKNEILRRYNAQLKGMTGIKNNDEFKAYLKDTDRVDITTEELKANLTEENQSGEKYVRAQVQMLEDYLEYRTQAGLFSDAINSVNHDTSGLGADVNASRNKETQKERVKATDFVKNMDEIYKTFIGSFDHNDFVIRAISQFYDTQDSPAIVKNNMMLLDTLTDQYTKATDKNKLSKLIENDFIGYVVQNYGYKAVSKKIDELFKGNDGLAREILRLKTGTNISIEETPLHKNRLIQAFQPLLFGKKEESLKGNIRIFNKKFDSFTSNELTESFKQIYDVNPELAEKLMDLGILQSGLNNSAITFMGIIPFEYYGDIAKAAFKKYHAEKGNDELYKFNQLFVRNNADDSVVYPMAFDLELNTQNDFVAVQDASGNTLRMDPPRKNGLGYGMYGKLFDKALYSQDLSDVTPKTKEVVAHKRLDRENQRDEKYVPEVIDNSGSGENANKKDYAGELVKPKLSRNLAIDPKKYTSYSGAAKGSDTVWHTVGKTFGIGKQVDYLVSSLKNLDEAEQLAVEDAYLQSAKDMNRGVFKYDWTNPDAKDADGKSLHYIGGLVRRDYLQVKNADAVFAIGTIVKAGIKNKKNQIAPIETVEGGTGYAVQMGINMNKPVFVFDQVQEKWFKFDSGKFVEVNTPVLTEKFAGVGTREINLAGSQAILDAYNATFMKAKATDAAQVNKFTGKDIYTDLGGKTEAGNVIIEKVYQQEGVKYAKSIGGIFTLRVDGTDKHFGNPYSSDERLVKRDGLIKTDSTRESVEKYIDWVFTSQEDRAKWIREQLKEGKLIGKKLLYWKELNQPSHANALDYLINKHDWTQEQQIATPTKRSFGTDMELHNAYISGGLDSVKEIVNERKSDPIYQEEIANLKDLSATLDDMYELESKESLTSGEQDRLIENYMHLKTAHGMDIYEGDLVKTSIIKAKLFDSSNKELVKGAVVEYNGGKYLFWNNNKGKAQLINTDGTKFSGTPNIDKLVVLGTYPTTTFNKSEYIVTDNGNIYSGASGNLVYTKEDASSRATKKKIIESVGKQAPIASKKVDGPIFLAEENVTSVISKAAAKEVLGLSFSTNNISRRLFIILSNKIKQTNIDNVAKGIKETFKLTEDSKEIRPDSYNWDVIRLPYALNTEDAMEREQVKSEGEFSSGIGALEVAVSQSAKNAQISQMKDDILNSQLSENDKIGFLEELYSATTEESMGKLIKKLCKLGF